MSILYSPWTSQPQQAVGIDWSNPLLHWADDVFVPVGGRWLKYSRPSSVLTTKTSNEQTTIVSQAGVGIIENPSSHGTTYARSGAYAVSSVSLLAVVTPKYFDQAKQLICGIEGYYDDGFYLSITYNSWSCRANIGGNVEIFGRAVEWEKPSVISMSWDGQSLSLKNPDGSYNSASASGTLAATSVPFSIGGTVNNTGSTSRSAAHLVIAGRRYASDSVRNQLHVNPWQIFKPIPRRIFVPVSAGGAPTLNPTKGGLVLTGYAPTVVAPGTTTLEPTKASTVATGKTPVINLAIALAPAKASPRITGYAPTLVQESNITLSPVGGRIAVTGYAPIINGVLNTVAGGSQAVRKPKRFYAMDGDKVLVFATAKDAIRSSRKAAETAAESVIEVSEVRQLAAAYQCDGDLDRQIEERNAAAIARIYAQLIEMENDDLDVLLLAA